VTPTAKARRQAVIAYCRAQSGRCGDDLDGNRVQGAGCGADRDDGVRLRYEAPRGAIQCDQCSGEDDRAAEGGSDVYFGGE
jgi:hypothetical protein